RADADLPVIAMTADAFSEDIQKCLECGMNDHLAKPIDVQDVVHKLKKYLR
ncbi:MAG: response regulator, partial [Lachnospiraceae bacterium]|nr:response regulator [Lachnospiraceae bacterium]